MTHRHRFSVCLSVCLIEQIKICLHKAKKIADIKEKTTEILNFLAFNFIFLVIYTKISVFWVKIGLFPENRPKMTPPPPPTGVKCSKMTNSHQFSHYITIFF